MNPHQIPTLQPQRTPDPVPESGYQSAPTSEPVYDQTRCYSQDEALEPASDTPKESTR